MFSDTVNKTVGDVSILKYFFHIKIFLRWQSVTAMMMDSSWVASLQGGVDGQFGGNPCCSLVRSLSAGQSVQAGVSSPVCCPSGGSQPRAL